jgi:hypothetical protein
MMTRHKSAKSSPDEASLFPTTPLRLRVFALICFGHAGGDAPTLYNFALRFSLRASEPLRLCVMFFIFALNFSRLTLFDDILGNRGIDDQRIRQPVL